MAVTLGDFKKYPKLYKKANGYAKRDRYYLYRVLGDSMDLNKAFCGVKPTKVTISGIGMSGGNVGYKGLNNLERKEWDREIPRLNELGGEGWMLVDKEGITFIFAREGV